jgi:hypothetical protein
MPAALWIAGFPPRTTETELRQLFDRWNVVEIRIHRQRGLFARVELASGDEVVEALNQAHSFALHGKVLSIREWQNTGRPSSPLVAAGPRFVGTYVAHTPVATGLPLPLASAVAKHCNRDDSINVLARADAARATFVQILRFFLWFFYAALRQQGGGIPPKLRDVLSGVSGSMSTFYYHTHGQLVGLVRAVVAELEQHAADDFVCSALEWWHRNQDVFEKFARLRNQIKSERITETDASAQLDQILPRLDKAYLAIESLGLALVTDTTPPNDAIAMSPVIIFRPELDAFDVFVERHGSKFTYRRYASATVIIIEPEAALVAALHDFCPEDEWAKASQDLKRWNAWARNRYETSNLDFSDLRPALDVTLIGRDDDLAAIEQLVASNSATLIEGPQGIGKSALMWTFAKQIQGRASLSYFFRERDERCSLRHFQEAAAIRIARSLGITIAASEPGMQFREAITALAGAGEIAKLFVFVVDGLDELHADAPRELWALLDLMGSTPPSITWVCATRPRVLTAPARERFKVHSLHGLTPTARYALLRGLLEARRDEIGADADVLLSEEWLQRVLVNADAPLPLYLREVVESVCRYSDYRDVDAVPPTLAEHWDRTVDRIRGPLALEVAALLAIAYAPLGSAELQEIMPLLTDRLDAILKIDTGFTQDAGGWSIAPMAFRHHILCAPRMEIERGRAIDALLTWAKRWDQTASSYPLRFLPRHLHHSHDMAPQSARVSARSENHRLLRELAIDETFLRTQTERTGEWPELPFETVERALRSAREDGLIAEALGLAYRHARTVAREEPAKRVADEIRAKHYTAAATLAALVEEEQEQALWKLLAATAALINGRTDTAVEIARFRLSSQSRGRQSEYEEVAAVLLGLAATACMKAGLDLVPTIRDTAAGLLGDLGRHSFFQALGVATQIDKLLPLLPPEHRASDTARRGSRRTSAMKFLAHLLGRQRSVPALLMLARDHPQAIADDLLVEGATGLAEAGPFMTAVDIALKIRSDNERRRALLHIAAEIAAGGGSGADLLAVLQIALERWSLPSRGVAASDLSDAIEQLTVAANAIWHPRIRTELQSLLAVVAGMNGGDVAPLLDLDPDPATVRPDNDTRHYTVEALIRLQRLDEATRVAESMPENSLAFAEITAAEIGASGIDPSRRRARRHPTCLAAALLGRAGNVDAACQMLIDYLVSSRPTKAKQPWTWGRPRVLGEIAGALVSLGEESGDHWFAVADRQINVVSSRGWQQDRAWSYLNLAQARLRVAAADTAVAAGLLHKSFLIATQGKFKKEMIAEILSEVWLLMKRFNLPDADRMLEHAKDAARNGPILAMIDGLCEIARRQTAAGDVEAARATLSEARDRVTKTGSREGRPHLLKGSARSGALSAEELNNLKWEIVDATQFYSKARPLAHRAEVERCLALGDFASAESALDIFDESDERAKAARSIAETYATAGRYDDALRVVNALIGARRGERLPDVADALVAHVLANESYRPAARQVLLELLVATSRHLDGTYRLISAIIASRAFDELTIDALASLIPAMELDVVSSHAGEEQLS